jgi:predicted nucleotidyltransferase
MKSKTEYQKILCHYFEEVASQQGVTSFIYINLPDNSEQNEDSDVDVAYEGTPNLFLRVRMKMDLEKLFGCKVDLIRLRKQFSGTLFGEELDRDLIYV